MHELGADDAHSIEEMRMWPSRDSVLNKYGQAIDSFEQAVRECPGDRWAESLWEVKQTDPWVWPKDGTKPIPERTPESIQVFSATWYVAAHCAFFLDFYLSGPDDFTVQHPFEPVAEEGFAEDGAIELPTRVFTREEVLAYIAHGRAKAETVLPNLTEASVRRKLPPSHPWAGQTYRVLLHVNLDHVREHASAIRASTN